MAGVLFTLLQYRPFLVIIDQIYAKEYLFLQTERETVLRFLSHKRDGLYMCRWTEEKVGLTVVLPTPLTRALRWTFTNPCKPEMRPGAREESASPAWLATPAMNARDTTKVFISRLDTGCGPTLYKRCHIHNTPGKRHNNTSPWGRRG